MRRISFALVTAAAFVGSRSAHADPNDATAATTATADPKSAVEVIAPRPTALAEQAAVDPGHATIASSVSTNDTVGLWGAPSVFAGLERPVQVVQGRVGIADDVAVSLTGAEDFMLGRFSGMSAGLELRLPTIGHSLTPTLALGYAETMARSSAAWARAGLVAEAGPVQLGATVRTEAPLGQKTSDTAQLATAAAITYTKPRFDLSLEHLAIVRSTGGQGSAALQPSITVRPTTTTDIAVRASAVLPTNGRAVTPLKIGVFGSF